LELPAAGVRLDFRRRVFMKRPNFSRPFVEKTYEIPDDEIPKSPRHLLLVEDDQAFAETLKSYLETCNFIVTLAKDGLEGVKQIMNADFEVIVCDMLMPKMPGNMFYVAVERTKPALARRFVFITGHDTDPKIAAFLKQIRGLCLFKPFQMHQLLETIEVVIKKNSL
jgi:DNA-binding response OmpR family regulator